MKNTGKVILLMFALLIILVSSGCQNKNKELDQEGAILSDENENNASVLKDESEKEGELHADAISYIMHSSEEIYLEYLGGSNILIFISAENRSEILDFFKTAKMSAGENDKSSDERSLEEGNFVLHIKNKGINMYIGDEYFVLHDERGSSKYYLEEDQIKQFNQLLTKVYLERANAYVHDMDAKEIQIEAVDTSQSILIKEKEETGGIIKTIELSELIPKEDLKDGFIQYPYYKMDIKSDIKEMFLVIVEGNVVRIELLGEVSYFRTKNDMMKLTEKYLTIEKPEDVFQRVFTAKKLRVESFDNEVMEYSDTAYITQIARSFNGNIKEDNKPANLFETKRIKLSFYVGDKIDVIEVYDNYIINDKDIYYKRLASEEILNILKQ
ncbi:MAG: hypothetical protein WC996_04595 [Peptostreptococcales bacterium]